jgi:hypothetical protein
MDSARYGLYSWLTSTDKPPELAMHDQLRQLAEQGDLTSAAIRFAQYAACRHLCSSQNGTGILLHIPCGALLPSSLPPRIHSEVPYSFDGLQNTD